jgi:hypothetical protein
MLFHSLCLYINLTDYLNKELINYNRCRSLFKYFNVTAYWEGCFKNQKKLQIQNNSNNYNFIIIFICILIIKMINDYIKKNIYNYHLYMGL